MGGDRKKKSRKQIKQAQEDGQVVDLQARRLEIDRIRQRLMAYGQMPTTNRLEELQAYLADLEQQYQGKPPCWHREYSEAARECRICDYLSDCSGGLEVKAELSPCGCTCGGQYEVELKSDDGRVRDFACCACGSLLSERELLEHPNEVKRRVKVREIPVIERPSKIQTMDRKIPVTQRLAAMSDGQVSAFEHRVNDMCAKVVEYVRGHPGAKNRTELACMIPGNYSIKSKAISKALSNNLITCDPVRGIVVP